MQCTAEEIERKRRIAEERLAKRKIESPEKRACNFGEIENAAPSPKQIKLQEQLYTPDSEYKGKKALQCLIQGNKTSSSLNNCRTNKWQKNNVVKQNVASTSTFYNTGNIINCNCSLISNSRFSVDMVGFSTVAIEIFKSIPSRQYDVHKKSWNFDIKDYELLVQRLVPLSSDIIVGKLPHFALKCCKNEEYEPSIDLANIDEEIRTSLYPYQEDGVCFGIRKNGRCLLADDMGLGKTIQALAIAHYYRNDWPLLIATTATMRNVWEESIHKFLPSVPLMKIQYLNSSKDTIENCLVLIVSHDLLGRCTDKLLSLKQTNGIKNFGVFIVGESHIFKNFQAKCTQKALLVAKASKRVILLSGTPALSKPSELFTQLQLIDDNFFGNFYDYSGFQIMSTLPSPPISSQSTASANIGGKKNDKKKYERTYEDANQLTPYQGTRRTFGFFHCLNCDVEWFSANTWANMGQDCFTCRKNTYPYRQRPLNRGSFANSRNKPHPEGHCEMCKFLKEPCKTKWVNHKKKMEENGGGAPSGEQSGPNSGNKSKKKNSSRNRNKTVAVVNEE